MKYFVTNNPHYESFEGFTIINEENAVDLVNDFILQNDSIVLDLETTGLDPYIDFPLLIGIASEDTEFLIDAYNTSNSFKNKVFDDIKVLNIKVIGHNIKFDIKFIFTTTGILLTNLYDTMIAEQRLFQKFGYRNGYADLSRRYLNTDETVIDKRIRMEFVGANPATFKFKQHHLDYASGDLSPLFAIKRLQDEGIYKKNMYNLIYKIENPLISIVAKAELEGFDFDSEKWKNLYERNLDKRFEIECKLDEEFRRLRDNFTEHSTEERLRCSGGKYDKVRVLSPLLKHFEIDGTPKGKDLFGNPLTSKQVTGVKKKIDFYPNNLNFQSDPVIIELFAHLKEPLFTKAEHYETPRFYKNKVDKRHQSFQTNEKAFKRRLVDYPKSKMNTFINLLLEHRKLSTRVNTFGMSFINHLNPITGKIHSEYRQCQAVTGRFQSGGGKRNPDKYNAQNIPRDAEMRNCFIAPKGYSIITADYSGAELIVMCSLSQDMDLLEMSKRDMHSEIATKSWREVYKHRAKVFLDLIVSKNSIISQQELNKLYETNLELSRNFIVDKSPEKEHLRTAFKPITFGTIYGLRAKGLAKYLSIEVDEAQVIINTIKKTFPKVFAMVESYSKFAEKNGYVIISDRTFSRAYFPNIIKELKGEFSRDIHFAEIMGDVNEARNIPIQGTQADFIKEASVRLQFYIDKFNIDATILKWVHDEIVTKCNNKDLEREDLKFTDTKGINYENLNFAEVKKLIMNDTANRYLKNVTIDTDYKIEPYWCK